MATRVCMKLYIVCSNLIVCKWVIYLYRVNHFSGNRWWLAHLNRINFGGSATGFYFLRRLPTRPLFLSRPNISAQRAYRRTGVLLFLLSFLFSSVLQLHFLPLTLPSVLLGVPSGHAIVGVLPSLGDSVEFRFLPVSFVFRLSRVSAFFCRVHLLSPLYFLVLWWSFSYVGFVFVS